MPKINVPIRSDEVLMIYAKEFEERDDKSFYLLFRLSLCMPYTLRQLTELHVMDISSIDSTFTKCLNSLSIKGNNGVKIPEEIRNLIEQYLEKRLSIRRWKGMNDNSFGHEPLFLKLSNWSRITTAGFSKAFYRIGKKYSIQEPIGIASLRKTYAQRLVEETNIYEAAELFGKSVSEMKRYLLIEPRYITVKNE